MRLIALVAFLIALDAAAPAWAHTGEPAWSGLPAEPWVLVGLSAMALGYAAGFRRLRRWSGSRIATITALGAFSGAFFVLFAALSLPLDRLSAQLFAAHMVQHLLLMLVAAPLLVWGRTAIVVLWALPSRLRRWSGSGWAKSGLAHVLRPLLAHPSGSGTAACSPFGTCRALTPGRCRTRRSTYSST